MCVRVFGCAWRGRPFSDYVYVFTLYVCTYVQTDGRIDGCMCLYMHIGIYTCLHIWSIK